MIWKGSDNLLHEEMSAEGESLPDRVSPHLWIAAGLLALLVIVFGMATPPGLLTKVNMVGYAVCHQIPSHSFVIGGAQLPLCARCTGTFLGALVGLLGQVAVLRRHRASKFAPPAVLIVLVGFTLLWAADGVNSYLALLGIQRLYESTNTLRLLTGALNGLTMSALIYPVFNVSVWRSPDDVSNIRNAVDLTILVALEGALVAVVLSGWSFLLYPLALASALAVLVLLTSVNTVLAAVLLGRENHATSWRSALLPIVSGLVLSFLQVGVIDILRYQLTGTLGGLPLP